MASTIMTVSTVPEHSVQKSQNVLPVTGGVLTGCGSSMVFILLLKGGIMVIVLF